MLLLLRMLSGTSPANPYQVYAQATPVLKIEPDNSPELPWVSYAVPGFIQIFIVSRAACGFRPLAKVVSARLRVYGQVARKPSHRGGSRIFFRRGCTRLLLYFNTNKPHSFFFLQNTSCIRKPQVMSGGGVHTPCTLPLDPPLSRPKFAVF